MISETIVEKSTIKHKGVLDFARAYTSLWGWLQSEGYAVQEKSYVEKIKPEGKTIEISWVATQTVENYFTYTITLMIVAGGLTKVDTEHNGEKMELDKATYELHFTGKLDRNINNEWPDKSFLLMFYERKIIPDRIEQHRILLYDNVMDLMTEVKNLLQLYLY